MIVIVTGCSSHDRPTQTLPRRRAPALTATGAAISPELPVEKPRAIDPETERLRSELRKTLMQDVDSLPQDEPGDTSPGTIP
jgi:hypothetical protein